MPAKKEKIHAHEHQSQASGKLQVDAQDSEYEMDAEAAAFHVIHGDQLQLPDASTGNSGFQFMGPNTIQRSAQGGGVGVSNETEQSIAESRGKGNSLSGGTKQEMEASLGGNFDGVNIHTDERAASLSADLQAEAFTVGQDIYFGKNAFNPTNEQGKHVLAHELRHTQQQGNNSGGEKIQRYVRYYSNNQYRMAPPGENADQETVDQFNKYIAKQTSKKEKLEKKKNAATNQRLRNVKKLLHGWRHPTQETLIVSNDGKMAVEDVGFKQPNHAWADADLITQANQILSQQGSYIKLEEQPNDLVVGAVPKDGSENTSKDKFKKIKPVHNGKDLTDAAVTAPMMMNGTTPAVEPTVIDDCGVACGLIMGTTRVTQEADAAKTGNEALPQATLYERYLVSGGPMKNVISQVYTNFEGDMKAFIQKVLLNEDQYKAKTEVTTSAESAHKYYMQLPFAERDAIDKKYGLQKYARPAWGQGVTIANANYSTTKEITSTRQRGGGTETSTTKGGNYHYATNIMDSGADYMAFEAYVKTTNWYFWMYGEDKGQTFYDKHLYDTDDAFGSGIMNPNAAIISPTNPN